jgi:multidrug efflux pump
MIPLVRSAFFGPMAVAMMGGILVATVLTLGFLPALYAAWFRVKPVAAEPTPAAD